MLLNKLPHEYSKVNFEQKRIISLLMHSAVIRPESLAGIFVNIGRYSFQSHRSELWLPMVTLPERDFAGL